MLLNNVFLLLKIVVIYYFIVFSIRLCFITRKTDPKLKHSGTITKLLSIISDDFEDFNKATGTNGKNEAEYKRGIVAIVYAIIAIMCVMFAFIANTLENYTPSATTMLLILLFKLIAYISSSIFWLRSFSNAVMQLVLNKSKISLNAIIISIISFFIILGVLLSWSI